METLNFSQSGKSPVDIVDYAVSLMPENNMLTLTGGRSLIKAINAALDNFDFDKVPFIILGNWATYPEGERVFELIKVNKTLIKICFNAVTEQSIKTPTDIFFYLDLVEKHWDELIDHLQCLINGSMFIEYGEASVTWDELRFMLRAKEN